MTRQPILLGVNLDHIATLRQARHTRYPDPIEGVYAAENAGADGITLHLREDRRHIQERDIELIQSLLLTRLNLEMAVTDDPLCCQDCLSQYEPRMLRLLVYLMLYDEKVQNDPP